LYYQYGLYSNKCNWIYKKVKDNKSTYDFKKYPLTQNHRILLYIKYKYQYIKKLYIIHKIKWKFWKASSSFSLSLFLQLPHHLVDLIVLKQEVLANVFCAIMTKLQSMAYVQILFYIAYSLHLVGNATNVNLDL
jgi:hypothetical protein